MKDGDKVKLVDSLIMTGELDGLVRADLVVSYTCLEDDDWETRDALRKVVKHYSTEEQYKEFEEMYIERDS